MPERAEVARLWWRARRSGRKAAARPSRASSWCRAH